jgi:(1->4)-alpha-D-glucan 1-alpha-D-glucosylmutase
MLDEICSSDRRARDFTRHALLEAIRETAACLPVYRTYIDERGNISEADRRYIETAIALAKRRNESTAPALFDFIRNILLLRSEDSFVPAENYRKRLRFTLKFQQLSGPVMAKGLEDTACYAYNRFVSVNEVGSSPREFGVELEHFHAANQQRAKRWPNSMLSTSTHDSKRSEDVRARLDVISEMPKNWATQTMRWRRANRSRKRMLGDGRAVPDANEEYLLYQTLVGAWPLEMADEEARETFTKRIQQYMAKAVHEAKINLSWTNQNSEYVAALEQFIGRVLQPGTRGRPNPFLEYIEQFVPTVAFFGCINSLAQLVLKLTCPGLPDVYQGTDLWDFSLVDPDNRRPVDYGMRQRYLGELLASQGGDLAGLCDELQQSYKDGRIKMWTTLRALQLRREQPEIFQLGSYRPLSASGEEPEHLVAFAREHDWQTAVVAVPRLPYTLCNGEAGWPMAAQWGNTELVLPSSAPTELRNVFTGETVLAVNHTVLCRELFAHFPVALLRGL